MDNGPIRLLMLTHGPRATEFARQLAPMGYDVTVVTISPSNRFRGSTRREGNVLTIQAPDLLWGRMRTGWDPWDTLYRILRTARQKFDLIMSIDPRPVSIIPALVAKYANQVPLVVDWGDWWGHGGTTFERSVGLSHLADCLFSPVETFFEEAFARRVDHYVVLSSALRQRAIGLGVQPNRISRVLPGVELDKVWPRDKLAARKALGIDPDEWVFGYVGKIFPRDAGFLVNAFARLRKLHPKSRLIVVSSFKSKLRQETDWTNIHETGWLPFDDLQVHVAACDAMWLPLCDSIANRGRWPWKVCDYLAAGKPVVATTVGDVAGLFTDGAFGVLSRDEPGEFANAAASLMNNLNREQMGIRARAYAEKNLSWNTQAGLLHSVFEKTLAAAG
jgi:glycosyltransferase involved in cell wall biosynthesis